MAEEFKKLSEVFLMLSKDFLKLSKDIRILTEPKNELSKQVGKVTESSV